MEISLEKIYRLAKKNILIILAVAIVVGAGAYAVMKLLVAPVYTVSAKCYIEDKDSTQTITADYTYRKNVVSTYIEILRADDFYEIVYNHLDDNTKSQITAKQIMTGTTFTSVTDTEVITVQFQNINEDLVYPVMAAIYDSIEGRIQNAYKTEGKIEMHTVSTPKPSSVAVSSSRTRAVTAVAAVLGAILALAFFYIRDMLDIHIRGANTIVEKYQLPVLGRVPSFDPASLRKKEASGDGKEKK